MILIDKLNVDMRTMKSSWNEDRVAASYCNRRPAKKQGLRPSALYAQHKINTDIVTVFTRRGREVYTRRRPSGISYWWMASRRCSSWNPFTRTCSAGIPSAL